MRRQFSRRLAPVLLVLAVGRGVMAYEGQATNKQPLSFGFDQALIDLNKLAWGPLEHEGVPPGPEIAILRGDMKTGPVEAVVRLPANYTFPTHSHTSDETYIWIKGDFTYMSGTPRCGFGKQRKWQAQPALP